MGGSTTIAAAYKKIDKTGFKATGGGQWEMDIPGVGGASILDETDTSLGGYGMYKVYSYKVWDKNYKIIADSNAGNLNDAKYYAKSALRGAQTP